MTKLRLVISGDGFWSLSRVAFSCWVLIVPLASSKRMNVIFWFLRIDLPLSLITVVRLSDFLLARWPLADSNLFFSIANGFCVAEWRWQIMEFLPHKSKSKFSIRLRLLIPERRVRVWYSMSSCSSFLPLFSLSSSSSSSSTTSPLGITLSSFL